MDYSFSEFAVVEGKWERFDFSDFRIYYPHDSSDTPHPEDRYDTRTHAWARGYDSVCDRELSRDEEWWDSQSKYIEELKYRLSYRSYPLSSCDMKVIKSAHFEKEYLALEKKFRKISEDIESFERYSHRELGTSLGSHLYKFRLKNSSIPTGQRWGFRIIWLLLNEDTFLLLSIYSKTEKENITDKEIEKILENIG